MIELVWEFMLAVFMVIATVLLAIVTVLGSISTVNHYKKERIKTMRKAAKEDVKPGHLYLFNTSYSDYEEYSGHVVRIERQLTLEECDEECQPMYKAFTRDGKYEMDVYLDELYVI